MTGTSLSAVWAMRWMPPSTTAPASTVSRAPVTQWGTAKWVCRASATELDCTVLPMPKPATMPNRANSTPSQAQRRPSPLRM